MQLMEVGETALIQSDPKYCHGSQGRCVGEAGKGGVEGLRGDCSHRLGRGCFERAVDSTKVSAVHSL